MAAMIGQGHDIQRQGKGITAILHLGVLFRLIHLARGLVRDLVSGHATETRGGGDGNPARLSVDGLQICPEMVARNTDLGVEIVIRSQGAGVL